MSTITSNLLNQVTNAYSNWSINSTHQLLAQDKEILKIGNVLNSIFVNRNDIDIPKLVVVGSQSSGKSSILNSILGLDILPTGSNMVTRGPLQLELIQSKTEVKAIFGEYLDGSWINLNEIMINYPNPTDEQKNTICSTIKQLTNQYAGDNMNITDIPINLRIYSPNIPNLSLVDLPGLTMVACTDKGQPKNIKDRIRSLIGKYIVNKESIILAVMPARPDIEADIALDLIKEYDPRGERTIGILTKIDLMNEGTDITALLENKVSKDLQMGYGYYGIKNRNKLESKSMSVIEGLKSEYEYFSNHPVYSNRKYKDNLGISNLCKNLGSILVKSLKKCFPGIMEKVSRELSDNQKKLENLGNPIPENDTLQSAYIHKIIASLTRSFISVLDDRGKNINSGRNIKQHFIDFRTNLNNLKPFDVSRCPDSYIIDAISNCEGNHMSLPSPPIEVLEQLIKDSNKKPIYLVEPFAHKCTQKVLSELSELVEKLVKKNSIERFPEFHKIISTTCVNDVFIPCLQKTYDQIDYELLSQENYIWTENINFINALENSNSNNVEIMRKLADNYYKSTIYILQDVIPKKIMYFLVNKSQKIISSKLYESVKVRKPLELLREVDDIHVKRVNLKATIEELINAKKLLEEIM